MMPQQNHLLRVQDSLSEEFKVIHAREVLLHRDISYLKVSSSGIDWEEVECIVSSRPSQSNACWLEQWHLNGLGWVAFQDLATT